MVSKGNGDGVS